ncbi:hypothetical protein CEUSTIGMA_g12032.t1 [Chlamydomonas eustigma]|uniref:Wings apart-like protein C-terminal domain-containing protein n=1 Tax=Chlamydomonas eustigma TaxID=1157962 RepID=A0A250XNE6_9CHLO|nr:hypothetical protein CEUSTIGMA_g12032.t1 [Chlamydomonas eustigma]|eukprot:GAX84611.1 hypothetical protein CEUSTIGMA_g12032.t1 [Chlamydomonas eustigma]
MKWFSIVSAVGLLIALIVQLQGPYRGWISSRNTNNAKNSSMGQTPPATSSIKTRRMVQDLLQQEDVNKRANAAASVVFLARNDAQMLTQMRREGVLHALAALIIGFEIPTREKHMTMSKEETKDTIEAVTASLVALALLSAGDEVSQGILMKSGLLPKVLRLMKTELGGWLAASSQLLYSLSKGPAGRDEIQRAVDNNAQWLAILAVRLLEGGAAGNSTDAMISSCRLMALLVGRVGAPGHAFLESQDTTRLMLQVLGMHHGKNGSTSDVVGALLEPLDHMIKDDNTVLQKIGETGKYHDERRRLVGG